MSKQQVHIKKLAVAIILLILVQSVTSPLVKPVYSQDYPFPPSSPDIAWQPPYEVTDGTVPQVGIEIYKQTWPNLQIIQPAAVQPGIPSSIINAYLVNSYGQILTSFYRNWTCYLVVSFNGPGYFYLWEYYPAGFSDYGHWLCYRWYCPHAGIWKIGPFTPEVLDPAGKYTWKMWFLSGVNWSTRLVNFSFTGKYYPPDIPGLTPDPVYPPMINSFSANKSPIETGETAILTWTTTNAESATISPDIGTVALSGSTSVTPATTTTYTLLAKGKTGNPVSLSTSITVTPHIPPSVSSSRDTINKGQSASLSWDAPGARQVYITDIGEVATSGTIYVSPNKTKTYTLASTYIDGTTQSTSATINVKQPLYWLWILIGLLVIAAVIVVIVLLLRRDRIRHTQPQEIQTDHEDSEETHYTNTLPPTTPLLEAAPAKLVMPDGKDIFLAGNARSFGRHDFEDFMPDDQIAYISRQHINIWYENDKYYIEDRSSTNGTTINNKNIKGTGRLALADGDVIELASKLRINFKQNINKEVQ